MRYKHLDNINVDLSVITAGAWPAGNAGYGHVTEKECVEAFHAMFDNGVNCIDAAPDYGNGVRNAAEAIENCGAFEWELTPAQIQAINNAIAANLDFNGEDKDI